MRILAFIGVLVVTCALSAGGAILVATQTPPDQRSWTPVATTAITILIIAPLLLGSALAFWDTDRSSQGRRAYRRSLLVTSGAQALSTVALCVYSAITGAPWWLPVLFAGAGVLLTAVAVRVGPAARRAEARREPAAASRWALYTRVDFRRDLRRIIVTAAVFLIASAGLAAILLTAFDQWESWTLLAYTPLFALMGAGFGSVLATMRLGRQQRDAVDGDLGRIRDIGKVVVRGKEIDLSADDRIAAARFAALSWIAQSYQVAWLVCLYVALAGVQVLTLIDDPSRAISVWLLIFFVVAFVAFIPVAVVQLRRTRRYAIAHRDLV